jgi:enoyl-CoA hydratase/carnithine racemase
VPKFTLTKEIRMTDDQLLRTEWEGVLELVLNRPDKLNALTGTIFEGIAQAVEDLRVRPELKVMLIRANGRYFSSGVDQAEREDVDYSNSPAGARSFMRRDLKSGMHRLYEEMERVEKPIVVAHHAMCLGGSLEMSLSCDFRLAAKSAGYWLPEMNFGMLPLSNGVGRLTRIVGGHWARWMAVANEKVTAERALIMGLVHEIYPDETFDEDVRAFCRKLAGFPSETVAAGKLAIEMAVDLPADQSRQLERLTFSSLVTCPGHIERSREYRRRFGGG